MSQEERKYLISLISRMHYQLCTQEPEQSNWYFKAQLYKDVNAVLVKETPQ